MKTLSPVLKVISAISLALLATTCQDASSPAKTSLPDLEIVDGATNNGNQHFFFLPPLRPLPAHNGAFDAALTPVVEICVLAQCGSSAIATYTRTSGEGSDVVRVDLSAEQYAVNWHTDLFELDPALTYRIRVLVGGRELGHADVDVVARGSELRRVDTGEYIPLLDGRTLPIKFRIEQGAVRPGFNVVSAASTGKTGMTVSFDAPPNAAQAATLANYSIPGLTLSAPVLSGNDVAFTTSSQAATTYTVTVAGINRAADGEPLTIVSASFAGTPANHAPAVNAGADQTITLPATTTLNGTVTDDGLPAGSTLTTTWTKVSGPGSVTFSDASAPSTTTSFSEPGDYVVRLTASDGDLSASDEVTVAVTLLHTITWTNGTGNNSWQAPGNWDQNRLPGPGDDVIVPNLGPTPVAHGAGNTVIQTLNALGKIDLLEGATVEVAAGTLANTFTVMGGATLKVLGGLTVNGDLILSGVDAQHSLSGSHVATVLAQGSQTLAGTGRIVMLGYGGLNTLTATGTDAVLTLGAGLQVGGSGNLGSPANAVINYGEVGPSTTIPLAAFNLTNLGTIDVAAELTLLGAWSNAGGTIWYQEGVVNLGGTFTTADIGRWIRPTPLYHPNLTGTLDNTGAVLDVRASGIGPIRLQGGTILNGTVAAVTSPVEPAPLIMAPRGSGTLDGVTLAAGLNLTVPTGATLTLRNGLTLDGRLTVGEGGIGIVKVVGSQTVGGSGEILLGTSYSIYGDALMFGETPGTILTLGPGLLVHGSGQVGESSNQVVNQGVIRSERPGLASQILAYNVTNFGVLDVSPGSVITVNGHLTNRAGSATNVAIQGTAPDQFSLIRVSGAAILAGSLNATLASGFTPAVGDRFRFLTFSDGLAGQFTTLNLPPVVGLETHTTDMELVQH